MEKYLNLAKVKRREFSLKGCNESFSKGVKSGVIKVMGKEDMVRLAIKPDGNCQFRAVATLLSGADDNDNHKVLRKLACEEFKNETVESLRRTGFFSHSESDCLTENVCKGTKKHIGGYLGSSVMPYRRLVFTKEEFIKNMRKDKTWGNEHTMACMAKALKVKINSIQEHYLKKNTYFVQHAYNPGEELELNILYDYEARHYEALVPSSWILTGNNNFQSESDPFASEEAEATLLIKKEKIPKDEESVPEKVETLKRKRTVNTQKNKRKKCEVPQNFSEDATVGDFMTWFVKLRTKQTEKIEKMEKFKNSNSKSNVFDEDFTDSELNDNDDLKESTKIEETLMNQDSDSEKSEEHERIEPVSDVSDFEESSTSSKQIKKLSDSEISENDNDGQVNYENEKLKDGIQTASEDSKNNSIKVTEKPLDKEIIRKIRQPNITDMFIKQSNKKQPNKNSEEEQNVGDIEAEFRIPSENTNFQKESSHHSEEDELDSDSDESLKAKNVKKKKKKKRTCKVQSSWFDGSKVITDANEDNIHSYLRRIPNSSTLVNCSVCCQSFSVMNKGLCAVKKHSETARHRECMLDKRSNENIGIYMERSKSQEIIDAELGIVKLAAVHHLSFKKTIPHLVKTLKKIFPDSKICQSMGSLSSSRLSYGLRNGLGKTEEDSTCKDLKNLPFSLELDGGLKGGKHRVSYLVHYFDENVEKVVIKVIITKTLNNENAKAVADTFLQWSEKNSIDIGQNMIMINSDHASVLRGVKTGATVRISEFAPNISSCDIGGDVLHDLNNANKHAFYRSFPNLVKLLDITKEDIGGSATKAETFQNICSKLGLETTKSKKWCRSRFLSRYECLKERRKRILAYAEYYSDVEPPRKRRKNTSGNNNFQKNSESNEEESSDE